MLFFQDQRPSNGFASSGQRMQREFAHRFDGSQSESGERSFGVGTKD